MSRETKPYREGKANGMNDKINIALQDITAIKETLDDAKVHYRGMYLMCFLLAAFNGVKYVWLLLEMHFMPRVMLGSYVMSYIWPLLLVVSFLWIYRSEKKYSNKYYLSMFGIWGFMAGVIPATAAVVNVFRLFTADGLVVEGAGQIRGSNFMESIASILLVSIFLVICGYILQKRIFMALAVLNLFCFMLLETCMPSSGIPFSVGGQTQTNLVYSSVYSIAVTCPGYVALGVYLWNKKKEERRESGERR